MPGSFCTHANWGPQPEFMFVSKTLRWGSKHWAAPRGGLWIIDCDRLKGKWRIITSLSTDQLRLFGLSLVHMHSPYYDYNCVWGKQGAKLSVTGGSHVHVQGSSGSRGQIFWKFFFLSFVTLVGLSCLVQINWLCFERGQSKLFFWGYLLVSWNICCLHTCQKYKTYICLCPFCFSASPRCPWRCSWVVWG